MYRALIATFVFCIAASANHVVADEVSPDLLFADLFDDFEGEVTRNRPTSLANDLVEGSLENDLKGDAKGNSQDVEPTYPVSLRFPAEVTNAPFSSGENQADPPSGSTGSNTSIVSVPVVNEDEPPWMQLRGKGVSLRVEIPVVSKSVVPRVEFDSELALAREWELVAPTHAPQQRASAVYSATLREQPLMAAISRVPKNNVHRVMTEETRVDPEEFKKAFAPIAAFVSAFQSSKDEARPVAQTASPAHDGPSRNRPQTTNAAALDTFINPSRVAEKDGAASPASESTNHALARVSEVETAAKTDSSHPPIALSSTDQPEVPQASTPDASTSGASTPDASTSDSRVSSDRDEPSIQELLLLASKIADAESGPVDVAHETAEPQGELVAYAAPRRVSRIWSLMSWLPILVFIPIILVVHKQRKQRDDREKRRLRAAQTNMQFPTRAEKRMARIVRADIDPSLLEPGVGDQVAVPVATSVAAEVTQQLGIEIDRVAAGPHVGDPIDTSSNPDWLTLGQSLVDEEISAAENAAAGSSVDFAIPDVPRVAQQETDVPTGLDLQPGVENDEWAIEIEMPSQASQSLAELIPTDGYVSEDLKRLNGIGPAIEKVLHKARIFRYSDLAATDASELINVLRAAGHPFNTVDPTTWAVQAALAMDGDWGRLVLYKMHENEWDVEGANLSDVPSNDVMNDLAAMMVDLQSSVEEKANTVPNAETGVSSAVEFDSYLNESN